MSFPLVEVVQYLFVASLLTNTILLGMIVAGMVIVYKLDRKGVL